MYPIHDFDVLLLMSTGIASKRRAAALVEILGAAELIQGSMPPATKLIDAFHRLSGYGLLQAVDGGYMLTPDGQDIVAGTRKKTTTAQRFNDAREKLVAYEPKAAHEPSRPSSEEMAAALSAYRTAARSATSNMLAPKPKVAEDSDKRYDQRRRFGTPPRRKKS